MKLRRKNECYLVIDEMCFLLTKFKVLDMDNLDNLPFHSGADLKREECPIFPPDIITTPGENEYGYEKGLL
jgi:hypothetical protein